MNDSDKQKLIIITGPTAVGKSAAAVDIARIIDGEIISADSMQVYRHMDIGTAKITKEEMKGVPHYLIDEFEPDEEFNVTVFKALAQKYIKEIASRGKIPIIAGGTGFYIQSVLYDVEFTEYDDDEHDKIREKLEKELDEYGCDVLFERLTKIDPEYASVIHKNNTRRLINSLAYYTLTGKKLSEHNSEQRLRSSAYDFRYIVINDDRKKLYERINSRVDKMLEDGLTDEVKALMDRGYSRNLPSMLGLGYKEIADYLSGECTLDEAVELIKRDTRHFAKKQLTWFKREHNIIEIDRSLYKNNDELINALMEVITIK